MAEKETTVDESDPGNVFTFSHTIPPVTDKQLDECIAEVSPGSVVTFTGEEDRDLLAYANEAIEKLELVRRLHEAFPDREKRVPSLVTASWKKGELVVVFMDVCVKAKLDDPFAFVCDVYPDKPVLQYRTASFAVDFKDRLGHINMKFLRALEHMWSCAFASVASGDLESVGGLSPQGPTLGQDMVPPIGEQEESRALIERLECQMKALDDALWARPTPGPDASQGLGYWVKKPDDDLPEPDHVIER